MDARQHVRVLDHPTMVHAIAPIQIVQAVFETGTPEDAVFARVVTKKES